MNANIYKRNPRFSLLRLDPPPHILRAARQLALAADRIQVHWLDDSRKIDTSWVATVLYRILDVEDSQACLGNILISFALLLLVALLVNGKLNDRENIGDHVDGVLQPNGHVVVARNAGHVLDVVGVRGSRVSVAVLVSVL